MQKKEEKEEKEGKVTGGTKQEERIPIQSSFKDSRPQRLSRDPEPSNHGEAGLAQGKGCTCPMCRQSWTLQHWNEQAAPSCAATLLQDGSRQLSLALPRFAVQAEMNIQELERHSHLRRRGLWAGSSREAPSPAACQSCTGSQLPSPAARPPCAPARRPGGSPGPAAAGHGSAGPWRGGRPELATQWDFSLIGCLAEG